MRVRFLAAVLALPIAACATDGAPPLQLSRPTCVAVPGQAPVLGCANTANLHAMIANPDDLIEGRPFGGSDAVLEAAAVERLRRDKVKKLRRSGTSNVGKQGDSE